MSDAARGGGGADVGVVCLRVRRLGNRKGYAAVLCRFLDKRKECSRRT